VEGDHKAQVEAVCVDVEDVRELVQGDVGLLALKADGDHHSFPGKEAHPCGQQEGLDEDVDKIRGLVKVNTLPWGCCCHLGFQLALGGVGERRGKPE